MIFHLLKYYQDKVFNFNYVIEIVAGAIFNINFFQFPITIYIYNTFINVPFVTQLYQENVDTKSYQ